MVDGTLICAPFGRDSPLQISFPEFKQINEDDLGWWHISCSISEDKVMGTIYARNSIASREPKTIGIISSMYI
jgi:hypothetical protein